MAAQRRRSKKRSAANSKLQHEVVFFIDRSLGKHAIANAVRKVGVRVEIHDDHLPADAPDEDWIALVARNNWLAITKDRQIRYRFYEKEAILTHGAKVLVVRAKNVTGEQIAEVLVGAIDKIANFSSKNNAPFIAGIDRSGSIKKYAL